MKRFCDFSVLKTEDELTEHYRAHLLNHLVTVFIWDGLSDDVPSEYLEMQLLLNGCCGLLKRGDEYVPIMCNAAERPDEFFRPTKFIYANPVLGSGEIDPDAVIYNDRLSAWFPRDCRQVINKYSRLLAAADISLKIALKNTRLTHIIATDNGDEIDPINKMLRDIWNGTGAVAVSTQTLIGDGIKVLPTITSGVDYLRQLSETREYLYNLFLSEFGIHANTVLKRERQLTGEIDMQIEKPMFNIESMLTAREQSAEKINRKLGLNLSVKINPKFMFVEESAGDTGETDNQNNVENSVDNSEQTTEVDNVPDNDSGDGQ